VPGKKCSREPGTGGGGLNQESEARKNSPSGLRETGELTPLVAVSYREYVLLLSMFDPDEKAIPKVGEKVNVPVLVRAYVSKAGLPRAGL